MKNKLNMCAKRMENSTENIFKLENLRFQAYNMQDQFEGLTYYAIGLSEGLMIPFGFYINDQLAAGCYVSAQHGTLFVEQLFVHPQIQNSGLRAGRLLLNYVLVNKSEIEEYFKTQFTFSALEALDEKSTAIYEKMGYKAGELYMRKPI